jgi:hypothetical protein
MASSQVQHERRASQRFSFQLPVALRVADGRTERVGVTQDVSARGAFIYTDLPVTAGSLIEFTLMLPSEVTLTEDMRVRCQGRAVRVNGPGLGAKFGVAAVVERYEFLADPTTASPLRPESASDEEAPEESAWS